MLGAMNIFEFTGPVSQMRRSHFTLASACGVSAVAFLAYCLIRGRVITFTTASDIASWSDFFNWFISWLTIIALHVVGCYLASDLIVEVFRRNVVSSTIWTDWKHFVVVMLVSTMILAGLVLFYSLAYKAMLDPEANIP